MSENNINVKLKVWRQKNANAKGSFEEYNMPEVSTDMSFLEVFDVLNERLITEGKDPYRFYQFWLNVADEDAVRFIKIYSLKSRSEIESLS